MTYKPYSPGLLRDYAVFTLLLSLLVSLLFGWKGFLGTLFLSLMIISLDFVAERLSL